MNTKLIYGGTLVPITKGLLVGEGYLVLEGNRIKKVGYGRYVGSTEIFDEVINAENRVVMPGLINSHGHAAMTLLRSYADDLPLKEWLEKKCWPIEDEMTEEDVFWGSMLAIVEMLKSGTTTFCDMYFHMDSVAEAVENSGIRAVLSRGMVGFPPKGERIIEDTRRFIYKWHGAADGRITTTLGPHSPYTCPPEYLRRVVQLSGELDKPIQIHLSETFSEVDECNEKYGLSPIALMKELGILSRPTLAAHCVHVDASDIEILAKYNVHVAHNPKSNQKLGSGIAQVSEMLKASIIVGLGTDGAASNNNLDMFEELRSASLIHKGAAQDPLVISAQTALEMATLNGAKALFLEDKLGTFQEGALADLIMLDYRMPYFFPRHDLVSQLVYAGKSEAVTDVMVDGQFLVRNRKCLTLNEDQIYEEIGRSCQRLFKKTRG